MSTAAESRSVAAAPALAKEQGLRPLSPPRSHLTRADCSRGGLCPRLSPSARRRGHGAALGDFPPVSPELRAGAVTARRAGRGQPALPARRGAGTEARMLAHPTTLLPELETSAAFRGSHGMFPRANEQLKRFGITVACVRPGRGFADHACPAVPWMDLLNSPVD